MSEDVVSTFQDLMFDLTLDAARRRWEPLNKILEREAKEQKAIDDRYLATLSVAALKHELFRRRLKSAERRYRNWWEENMEWRFAPYAPERSLRLEEQMSDRDTLLVAPAAEDVEDIVFGSRCKWCEREEPCECNRPYIGRCACTCGRCLFDGPLPDDGPLP